jgi:hypothetical protein
LSKFRRAEQRLVGQANPAGTSAGVVVKVEVKVKVERVQALAEKFRGCLE